MSSITTSSNGPTSSTLEDEPLQNVDGEQSRRRAVEAEALFESERAPDGQRQTDRNQQDQHRQRHESAAPWLNKVRHSPQRIDGGDSAAQRERERNDGFDHGADPH